MPHDEDKKKAGVLNFGILSGALNFVLLVVLTFILSLFFSIIIEWLGMFFEWWALPGAEHAKLILMTEYGWLNSEYQGGVVQPVEFANIVMNDFDQMVVRSDALSFIVEFLGSDHVLIEYVSAMMFVMQTMLLRVVVILVSLPALLLFVVFAVIDGFSERDVRAWSVGDETAFVYHHAKAFMLPFMVFPMVLYLSVPISIHPSIFMLVFALPASLMVWTQAKYFKKKL